MSAIDGLLGEQDLFAKTGFKRRDELERWLNAHGVLWWPGKGGAIVTTLEALNRALLEDKGQEWGFGIGKAA